MQSLADKQLFQWINEWFHHSSPPAHVVIPFTIHNNAPVNPFTCGRFQTAMFLPQSQLFWIQVCNNDLKRAQKTLWWHLCFILFILLGQNHRNKRDSVPPSTADVTTVHSVPLGIPIYLSCPIESYHAVYTWKHGLHSSPCLQMQSNCLHIIPVMTQESYGHYKCISIEKNYTKEVKNYHLAKQIIPDTTRKGRGKDLPKNDASAVVPRIWIVLGIVMQLTTWNVAVANPARGQRALWEMSWNDHALPRPYVILWVWDEGLF